MNPDQDTGSANVATRYAIQADGPLWWTGQNWSPVAGEAATFEFMTDAVLHAVERIGGRRWRAVPVAGGRP